MAEVTLGKLIGSRLGAGGQTVHAPGEGVKSISLIDNDPEIATASPFRNLELHGCKT